LDFTDPGKGDIHRLPTLDKTVDVTFSVSKTVDVTFSVSDVTFSVSPFLSSTQISATPTAFGGGKAGQVRFWVEVDGRVSWSTATHVDGSSG
jgi:hypothetical protein